MRTGHRGNCRVSLGTRRAAGVGLECAASCRIWVSVWILNTLPCDPPHKGGWTLKNGCIWTVVWKRLLRVPWTLKEIQPVHPKGDQSWVFIGRTDVEAETPTLWPPDAKSWLIGKDPNAGKDWGQEKGTTEDEMVGWHHRLSGHGFGWTLGVGDGQGVLACCGSWCHIESDTTQWLNWTEWCEGGHLISHG